MGSIANQSYFWPIIFALIGGGIVVVGLVIELFAEKKWFKNLRSKRFWDSAKTWGEWIVIIGIVFEMGDAGWTAYEINENNPLNQPISTVSASVKIIVKGAKNVELDSYTNGMPYAASLDLCSDVIRFEKVLFLTNSPPNKSVQIFLPAGSASSVVSLTVSNIVIKFVNNSGSPVWEPNCVPGFPSLKSDRFFSSSAGDAIEFGFNGNRSPNGENLQFRELPEHIDGHSDSHEYNLAFRSIAFATDIPVDKKAKDINNIKAILIHLNFLPHDAEIIGGIVRVDVNNFKKIFVIPPQTNAPLDHFEIVTTNVWTTFD
jgi:hypothetical protein